MSKRKRLLLGIFALVIGLSASAPMRASADDYDYHHHHHHSWRWRWENDRYRAYPYEGSAAPYAYGSRYGYRPGYIPPNGQGMIDPRNPNFYWACDSQGHHCRWARR